MELTTKSNIKPLDGNSTSRETYSSISHVKKRKDQVLKVRLDTLIKNVGLSQREFYKQLGISRQAWYGYSWGLISTPVDLKVRIARLLNTDTSLIYNTARPIYSEKGGDVS